MDYILQNVSWMDPQTKKNALEKSKVLKVHIGYPDELLDDDKIDLHYKDLRIGKQSHYHWVAIKAITDKRTLKNFLVRNRQGRVGYL